MCGVMFYPVSSTLIATLRGGFNQSLSILCVMWYEWYNATSIDIIYFNGESMAGFLNNRILLDSVGYTRRGNTTKTVVQPDRFVRRAYTSTRMLCESEQSSHWNKWLIWNTWTMLCEPQAKWTLCNYMWLTALTPRGCNRIDKDFCSTICLISKFGTKLDEGKLVPTHTKECTGTTCQHAVH